MRVHGVRSATRTRNAPRRVTGAAGVSTQKCRARETRMTPSGPPGGRPNARCCPSCPDRDTVRFRATIALLIQLDRPVPGISLSSAPPGMTLSEPPSKPLCRAERPRVPTAHRCHRMRGPQASMIRRMRAEDLPGALGVGPRAQPGPTAPPDMREERATQPERINHPPDAAVEGHGGLTPLPRVKASR